MESTAIKLLVSYQVIALTIENVPQQVISNGVSLKPIPVYRDEGMQNILERQDEDTCSCGEENTEDVARMEGGELVSPANKYPWVVALVYAPAMNTPFCGGALISHTYVLTAAHCLQKQNIKKIAVAFEANDLKQPQRTGSIERLIPHPNYKPGNDIGLVKLRVAVLFYPRLKPLCIPSGRGFESDIRVAKQAGWGVNRLGKKNSTLSEVTLPVIKQEDCVRKYGSKRVWKQDICAGGEAGKGPCPGDSGTPLFGKRDGRYYALGVSAFVVGKCGTKDRPSVYTRVSEYLDWIQQETADDPPCSNPKPTILDA